MHVLGFRYPPQQSDTRGRGKALGECSLHVLLAGGQLQPSRTTELPTLMPTKAFASLADHAGHPVVVYHIWCILGALAAYD